MPDITPKNIKVFLKSLPYRELSSFAIVGGSATITHYAVGVYCTEAAQLPVTTANTIAYLTSLFISLIGHSYLTFKSTLTKVKLLKFTALCLINYSISQSIAWGADQFDTAPHITFALIVITIPISSYLISKLWIYKK